MQTPGDDSCGRGEPGKPFRGLRHLIDMLERRQEACGCGGVCSSIRQMYRLMREENPDVPKERPP